VIPERLTSAELDDHPWIFGSPTLRALDYTFQVRTSSPELAAYLPGLLETFPPSPAPPSAVYSLFDLGDGVAERWQAYVGDLRVASTGNANDAVRYLLWHLNRKVVESSPRYTLLHAAAVALDGQAVIMPAAMDSGKTTTTAGLLRSGLSYLTDEIVALDPETLQVAAYPRTLNVDPGSWDVLRDLEPDLPDDLRMFTTDRWDLRPGAFGPDTVAYTAEPALIVAPRYVAGAPTSLDPVGQVRTARALSQSTFKLGRNSRRDLDVLGRLARTCPGYQLTIGDLDEACRLVLECLTKRVRRPRSHE
jgi:hypothetical protein